MGQALIKAVIGVAVIMLVLIVLVAISQVIAQSRWRANARTDTTSAPQWRGHTEAAQSEALWGSGPPRIVRWFWRGLYPVTLRARPDGLLLTARGRIFSWWCGHPSAVIPWAELVRGQERRLGRTSIELGPSAVPLTRVSLSVAGATAVALTPDTIPRPIFLRFVTAVPDGLAQLVNHVAARTR